MKVWLFVGGACKQLYCWDVVNESELNWWMIMMACCVVSIKRTKYVTLYAFVGAAVWNESGGITQW